MLVEYQMILFNNGQQALPCRLAWANVDPKVGDLVVRWNKRNHLVMGIQSTVLIISFAVLSPVYAGVEDLRAVNITGAYLRVNRF